MPIFTLRVFQKIVIIHGKSVKKPIEAVLGNSIGTVKK